jgi:hypothetical protein
VLPAGPLGDADHRADRLPTPWCILRIVVPTPFSTLLYRYFFYGWLFCDAGRGSVWERAAAWRHNRAQARWLPTYIRRWLVIGAGLFAAAWFVERMLLCPALSTFFYVPSALSVPFNAFTALCWTCLVHDRSL